jgi:CDP-diacylglycerol--glycerol-3-phosphate 3-phosphatidyltransferase
MFRLGPCEDMQYQKLSLSLQLTLIRFIGALFVLPFFIVYLLPFNNIFINNFVAVLFLFVGATDFFDGYFARKYQQVTAMGATLDHLADKFLLYTTLIALVVVHKIYFVWAIVWIGREFLIMGLRISALEESLSITVSLFGKSKTVVQIICLAFIIFNPYQEYGVVAAWWNGIELFLIVIATTLSVYSVYLYFIAFVQQNNSKNS